MRRSRDAICGRTESCQAAGYRFIAYSIDSVMLNHGAKTPDLMQP